ncbi:hypothetical protein MMF93_28090 [Streptomyces tubbatahanensis]|uniref:Transposase n=1 Tax=Streptomyces tubbatahanensis TaxID=2923272 RepID=A0ABY3XZA3_9ACTN|nr:hypothetical protein [Streptomyces tubbatahanensis]UNS99885.1 hypothetical protein MMF93_28090 [Streptomyces tubbatahanensis]
MTTARRAAGRRRETARQQQSGRQPEAGRHGSEGRRREAGRYGAEGKRVVQDIRPELTVLDAGQRQRVRRALRDRKLRCPHCRRDRFEVGEALYLGFLFLDEATDAYLVALRCTNRACPLPRTGVTLGQEEFMSAGHPEG